MIQTIDHLLLTGWREWCALPELEIPAVKVKIDTGARTSALHAFNIHLINKNRVAFSVYPIQGKTEIIVDCEAGVVDKRYIMSSNGHKEYRYVILTKIKLGDKTREIELSLSDRDPLKFRMLLGREALKHWVIIDPKRSYCQGKIKKKELQKIYS